MTLINIKYIPLFLRFGRGGEGNCDGDWKIDYYAAFKEYKWRSKKWKFGVRQDLEIRWESETTLRNMKNFPLLRK